MVKENDEDLRMLVIDSKIESWEIFKDHLRKRPIVQKEQATGY